MVKIFDIKFTVNPSYFRDVQFPATIVIDEDDYFYFVRLSIDPWTDISMTFDKNVYESPDNAYNAFKFIVKQSYNII